MHPVQPQIDRLRRRHVGRGGHLLGVVSGGVTTSGGGKMAEVWVGVDVEVKVVWGAVTQTQDGGGGQHTDAERRQVRSDNGTRHLRYGEPSNNQQTTTPVSFAARLHVAPENKTTPQNNHWPSVCQNENEINSWYVVECVCNSEDRR